MTEEEIKKIIIDELTTQQAFKDLSPLAVVSFAIDMLFAILKKASEK
jgi:hypothetical protein